MSNLQVDQLAIDRFRFEAEEAFARHGFRGQVEILRDRINKLFLVGSFRFPPDLAAYYFDSSKKLQFVCGDYDFLADYDKMEIWEQIRTLADLWESYHYSMDKGARDQATDD